MLRALVLTPMSSRLRFASSPPAPTRKSPLALPLLELVVLALAIAFIMAVLLTMASVVASAVGFDSAAESGIAAA